MSAVDKIDSALKAWADHKNSKWAIDITVDTMVKIRNALSDLKREMEQDKRDAERYRWLRDKFASETVDEAIDAAIAAKKDGV